MGRMTNVHIFLGELKVTLRSQDGGGRWLAFVRLKEGAEESCLWRVRCEEEDMLDRVKDVLTG
jgi:hypothetical protein